MAFEFDLDNVPSIAELSNDTPRSQLGTASTNLEAYHTSANVDLGETRSSSMTEKDLGNDYSVKNLAGL